MSHSDGDSVVLGIKTHTYKAILTTAYLDAVSVSHSDGDSVVLGIKKKTKNPPYKTRMTASVLK